MTNAFPAQLSEAWFDSWRTKDAGLVERLMAHDYVYVAPNGAVMDRDAILAIIRDPSYAIIAGEHSEVTAVALGQDVSLVRHRWRGHGRLRGNAFVDDHRCVMVWVRSHGQWRVYYEQASLVTL